MGSRDVNASLIDRKDSLAMSADVSQLKMWASGSTCFTVVMLVMRMFRYMHPCALSDKFEGHRKLTIQKG